MTSPPWLWPMRSTRVAPVLARTESAEGERPTYASVVVERDTPGFTMGPKLAAMACQRFFSFETVIPCHYGTFPLLHGTAGDFVARMEDSTTEVVVPERGVAIEL